MIVVTDKSKCNGCHACYNACPKHCIEMKADNLGFLYPVVNEVECVNCNICEKVCPILSDRTKNTHALQIGYAAYNSDEAIRLESSSGGVFTLLAEYILQNGGIVIGASMKEDNKGVHHIVVDNINDLEKLRTSKYVQSEIGNTYKKAQNALKNGKLVLFTGTPCQIGGLYSYLGQDYDNLYTQDLICHGVPSPYIWKKYVEMRETQFAAKLRRTNFRHKKYGWNSFTLLLEFSNNKAYEEINPKDLFLRGFLTNLYLRKSCYDCQFKTRDRQADITLADFWSIGRFIPEFDDKKGTSFVWIHSDKGVQLFDKIKNQMVYQEISPDTALSINIAAEKSSVPNRHMESFDKEWNDSNLWDLIEKYVQPSLVQKTKILLLKLFHRI